MSKNTPITARVSTGLFNKKKGVAEPLLNVGKAGVHGNNQTRDIPSPSKIKGYAMKSSPFKQTMTDGKPVEATVRSAGELITQQGPEITKTGDFDKKWDVKKAGGLTYAEWIKKPGNKAKEDKFIASKQEGTGEFGPSTTTQGPDKEINLKDFEVEGKRGMVESWEAGSQARRMKKLSDDISDSQKKIGRYQSRLAKHTGKDGKALKGHERRFRNATANLAESTRNMQASQGQYDVYSKGVSRGASGYRGGTFNVTEQATKKSLGDVNKQIEFESKQLKPKDVVTKTNPLETPNKKSNKFFKKATPLKMKYFK